MRLIKVTGGLGNQMFIYAFYLRMKKYYPKVRIDLSDMMCIIKCTTDMKCIVCLICPIQNFV